MLKEEYLQQLLNAVYGQGPLNVYDYAATAYTEQSEEFGSTKLWADQLVRDKLATYSDQEHTILQITNFGKYWILKGGYESFLKDGQRTKKEPKESDKAVDDHKINLIRKEKEELIEARLKLTHYRLIGFWLTIVLSAMGFLLSLYNLYLILSGRK